MTTDASSLPEVTVGDEEPASSRLLLLISTVAALGLLMLHNVLYPGQDLPVFGELVPLFGDIAHSGIWFFLIGTMIGFGLIVATLIGEVIED
jgi:hypothetical protein